MIYKLGDLVELVTETNSDLKYGLDDIVGVTIEKEMITTIANLTETDLDKFVIVRPYDFIYNPRTHGKKIGLGYNTTNRNYIATWNNNVFRVKKNMQNIILPDYLYMYFLRERWDKEACFHSWGSSTVVFLWESFCNMQINLPSIEEQRKFVNDYKVITDRIELLNLIDNKLQTYLNFAFSQFLKEYKNESKIVDVNELIEIQSGLAYDAEFLTENESDNLLISMSNASLGKIFIPNKMKHYSISVDNKYCGHSGDLFVPTRDLTQACNILSCPAIIPDYYSDNNIILGTNLYKIEKYFYGEETKYWLYLLFNSSDYRKYIKECANGSAILMIKKEDILNYKIAIPNDKDLFCKFNERVKSLFEIRNAYYSEIQNLLKLKELILINMGRGVK